MKTINLLLLSFLLYGATAKSNDNTTEFSKTIRHSITMPESFKQNKSHSGVKQKVQISFMINEEGKVSEVNARTNDAEAKKDIEKQFIQLNFKGLEPCVLHQVEVSFIIY